MLDPKRTDLIKKIEKERDSRLLCYLTSDRQNANASVSKDVIPVLFEHLRAMGNARQIDLFLFTRGGDTLVAFNIAQLLRQFAKKITILVPFHCHSAGTLIALGANQIVMARGATLSPIDPSVQTPLNPVVELNPGQRQLVPLSVESVAGFRTLVTEEWGINGQDALAHAFKTLADKVHPLALGDVFRARQQIEELAKKLLRTHRKDDDQALPLIIRTLTRNLGSHDYPISPNEAESLLGSQVVIDTGTLEEDLWQLYSYYAAVMQLGEPFDPNATAQAGKGQPVLVDQKLALVESVGRIDAAEKVMNLQAVQQQMPAGLLFQLPGGIPAAATKMEIVRTGWKRYP